MFKILRSPYTGKDLPVIRFDTREQARTWVARRLKLRRASGFPVRTIESGKEWEVLEPAAALGSVVDTLCGLIELTECETSAKRKQLPVRISAGIDEVDDYTGDDIEEGEL